MGWKVNLQAPIPPKCVLCVAPHTSNWDFLIGIIYFQSVGGNLRYLMKKSLFFFPLNLLLKALGGIPVDRNNRSELTELLKQDFANNDNLQLAITPEGTRSENAHWKTGFYYIALDAGVPISLAYLDYANKSIGILENFKPTGNNEQDMLHIKAMYKDIQGKHPEQFSI
ncbi:acyltransferase [Bacteroidia bacterium]|nr:acyltransferase [Bacteroidia bacterium]